MKSYSRILLAFVSGFLICTGLFAQGQITTRREKLKDFTTKITKVVLPQEEILSEAIREGVTSSWTVSPYEFCTQEEFEKYKTNSNFYFLVTVNGKMRKEVVPGIKMLTLVKGGEKASGGINDMLEVVTFPICSATGSSGREMIFIPAILKEIQKHATSLTDSEMKAYRDIKVSPKDQREFAKMRVYVSREDLAPQVSASDLKYLSEDLIIDDEDVVDSLFIEGAYKIGVSYVVAPEEPEKSSVCYKMIFSADTQTLLYYKKHKITARRGKGFLPEDLSSLSNMVE